MNRFISLAFAALALLPISTAQTSVLGTEPGEHRLNNDDLGIILWGPDDAPTLSVGKSDIWDRRNPPSKQPVLTMKEIVERIGAGDKSIMNGAGYYTNYGKYDFPCPKPGGQLIVQMPFVRNGGTLTFEKDKRHFQLHGQHGEKKLDLRISVSAVENVIVLDGTAQGLDAGDVSIRVYRHRDTIVPGGEVHPTIGGGPSLTDFEQLPSPRVGMTSSTGWVAQDFTADPTFPSGFSSVLAVHFSGAANVELLENQTGLGTPLVTPQEGRLSHGVTKRFTPINESPGCAATLTLPALNGSFTAYATISTTQDANDPVAHAIARLSDADSRGADAILKSSNAKLDVYDAQPHARAWKDDGTVIVDQVWGGVPYAVRPQGYFGDIALCSVDSTKFCYQDSSMWHADFHFNEIDATTPCILRQFDSMASYFHMIQTLLPMAQAHAREVYDVRGAMYPLVHFPLKSDSVFRVHLTWEQSVELTALLARPFWLRFQYTWDMRFLREQAYPVLREGARFYSDYVKLEADGLYHVSPTVSPEHRGLTEGFRFNRDSQSALTMIRYTLRAASEGARLLDIDAEERAQWIAIEDKLAPYPTVESPEGPIYIDVAGAEPIEYNIPVPLSAVFWGDDIGLDSPEEQLTLARRTLKLINVWEPHRGYLLRVRARLGEKPAADAALGYENLIQSHTGVIRLFPAVPEGFSGGFENFGAQGAFVVGAKALNGTLESASIMSLAGNPCRVMLTHHEATWRIIDTTSREPVNFQRDGEHAIFETVADHTYTFEKVTATPPSP